MTNEYIITIDGKCIGNEQVGKERQAYWIALFNRKCGESNRYYGEEKSKTITNNKAEYNALILALEKLPENAEAEIRTDSQLVFGQLCEGWENNNFINEVKKIDELIQKKKLKITFTKIDREDNTADFVLNAHLKKIKQNNKAK